MKKIILLGLLGMLSGNAAAYDAVINYQRAIAREDGTSLEQSEIATTGVICVDEFGGEVTVEESGADGNIGITLNPGLHNCQGWHTDTEGFQSLLSNTLLLNVPGTTPPVTSPPNSPKLESANVGYQDQG